MPTTTGAAGLTLDEVRAFARTLCEEAGDAEAMDRLKLSLPGNRLSFGVVEAASCGASIAGYLRPGRERATIANALNRILRQRARDRAIAASGEEGTPAWSVDAHPVVLSALAYAGVHPATLCMLGEAVGPSNPLQRMARGPTPRFGDARLVAGRVCVATIAGDDLPFSLHEDNDRQQCLSFQLQLPEAVVAGLPGRPLGDVVDHPLLALALGVRILRAHSFDGNLVLDLDDERRTLAPAPGGADWLRFPWLTIMD